jgi:AcrR family transcriptional regulator
MLSAMVDVSCELGAGNVSVSDVVKRSGVSRRTFYEMFNDREDCFKASFAQALSFAAERVSEVYDADARWAERMRTGLVALLSFFDEEPRLARVLLIESLTGGPRVAAQRSEVLAQLAQFVDEGRLHEGAVPGVTQLTSEGLVGAVSNVLQSRLLDPKHEPLLSLANELASMIVLPYLGSTAARRELRRALPVLDRKTPVPHSLPSDPFKEVRMRLTYRTVRVLSAIAEHPGASNRLVGEASEVTDQGQISKLLKRLRHNGMIVNTGAEVGQGGPNVWTLTQTGERFLNGIRSHAEAHGQESGKR